MKELNKVSLLLSERSAVAGERKGGKGLAGFYPLFGHFQNTETWWCSLLAQKNLFGLVAMVQLKPSCSHSSSIQIVFNNLNEANFLIFLSRSTTTIVPAGKSPQMAHTSTVASHKKCINNSPDSCEAGKGKTSNPWKTTASFQRGPSKLPLVWLNMLNHHCCEPLMRTSLRFRAGFYSLYRTTGFSFRKEHTNKVQKVSFRSLGKAELKEPAPTEQN